MQQYITLYYAIIEDSSQLSTFSFFILKTSNNFPSIFRNSKIEILPSLQKKLCFRYFQKSPRSHASNQGVVYSRYE